VQLNARPVGPVLRKSAIDLLHLLGNHQDDRHDHGNRDRNADHVQAAPKRRIPGFDLGIVRIGCRGSGYFCACYGSHLVPPVSSPNDLLASRPAAVAGGSESIGWIT
jgi:hypothetical protein